MKDAVFNDYKVLSAGKGSGLHGIPGDSTSVSRFVRASYLLKYSDTVTSKDSVNKAFHILATPDIVKGGIKLDLPEDRNRQYTQYTSVYDLSKKQLYIKMYEYFTIQMIEFDDTVANQDKTKVYELVKVPKYKVLNDK